jgi:hypothetical protein
VQDRRQAAAQAATAGDVRAGTTLALAGGLLLASAVAGLWTGSLVVPTALAVALLVVGGFLLLLRAGFFAGRGETRRTGIHHFASHVEPVFVSDLDGRVRAANPAALAAGSLESLVG